MSLSLQMSIKRNVLYVRLRGELDQASVERLKYRVTEVINKYYIVHIVINLKEVPFMDSSGIGFIIGRYSQLKERKGKVVVCSMNELIERIFTLSGLKKICLVAASEDEAQNILEVAWTIELVTASDIAVFISFKKPNSKFKFTKKAPATPLAKMTFSFLAKNFTLIKLFMLPPIYFALHLQMLLLNKFSLNQIK